MNEKMTKGESLTFISWCWLILTMFLIGGILLGLVIST